MSNVLTAERERVLMRPQIVAALRLGKKENQLPLRCIAIAVCAGVLMTAPSIFAQTPQEDTRPVPPKTIAQPPQYMMYRARIQQKGPAIWGPDIQMWYLEPHYSTGPMPLRHSFRSLADPELRQWVSHLPAGSSITCGMWLGPARMGHKLIPDALKAEMDGFTQLCRIKSVTFGFIGSAG